MSLKDNHAHFAFNRGMLSPLGLGRIDLKRTALSAEIQTNWIPRVLGSAMLRPGLEYKGVTKDNATAVYIPFIFASNDKAVLEFTDNTMRVRIDDEIITRQTVDTSIINGSFTTDLSGWTNSDESGATSSWAAGSLAMIGNSTGTAYCILDQYIVLASPWEHGLRIKVGRGPVEIKVGSSQGAQDYFGYSLGTGIHSIGFSPYNNFWIRIRSRQSYTVLLDDINFEYGGDLEISTDRDADDLSKLRYDQSGDIIFIACADKPQTKVERRATVDLIDGSISLRSWSWVVYEADEGPFLIQNLGTTTLLPSALNGDITLTASAPLFESTHVGALFKVTSNIQNVTAENVSAEDTFTDPILVTGITDSRIFTIEISDLTDSTVTLQRSILEPGSWSDVQDWTTNTVETYDDDLDNQTVYYRIGIKTGDYGTDTSDLSLLIESGSITGVCRITDVVSDLSASAVTLKKFGTSTVASSDWSEGRWSDKQGYPTAVGFHEGRLWWAGKDRLNGSVSDSFYNYNPDYEGDAAPIDRSIGQGPVDNINWMSSGKTLLLGCDSSIKSVNSSNLDEPLTVSNINIKDIVTQGTASMAPVKIDREFVFVQASGTRVYSVGFDVTSYDYGNIDLTAIVPEIGEPSIIKIVVQRQPDTRIHCIRSDGKVALLIYDKVEDVKCWVIVETPGANGLVEDALVLPGQVEDDVYYLVNRTISGSTKRYWEKWTHESDNKGGAKNLLSDSHLVFLFPLPGANIITGLDHLEGESVVVWGNSRYLGTYTVNSGQITLDEIVFGCIVGLTYNADFKSVKPALSTAHGSSLLQKKIISQLGLLMADTHAQGLKYGPDFDHLDDLPARENGADVDQHYRWTEYDEEAFVFPGSWDTDSRICLRATAPLACTLLALVIDWNTNEKV